MSNISVKAGALIAAPAGILVSFTLEVFGAIGAVWGASEVVGLRDENNAHLWRSIACVVGALSFLSYVCRHFPPEQTYQSDHLGVFSAAYGTFRNPYGMVNDVFIKNRKIQDGDFKQLCSEVIDEHCGHSQELSKMA